MSILDEILARSRMSPTTRAKYTRVIRKWLEFAGEDPSGWTRPRAQAFYDAALARGVSARSANVYAASLRYVSKWYAIQANQPELDFAVIQTQYIATENERARGDRSIYDEPEARQALTQEQAMALIATCNDATPYTYRDRALIIVGLETGMRRMSLADARFENINRRGAYPTIKVQIKGAGGARVFPVPLSETAMAIIDDLAQRSKRKSGPLFMRYDRAIGRNGRLEYTPIGDGISQSMIYKLITARAKLAGISDMHPHILRHTFVTWREGAGLTGVQIASITGSQTFGIEWQNLRPYIHMDVVAERVVNSATPAWLAELVQKMVNL